MIQAMARKPYGLALALLSSLGSLWGHAAQDPAVPEPASAVWTGPGWGSLAAAGEGWHAYLRTSMTRGEPSILTLIHPGDGHEFGRFELPMNSVLETIPPDVLVWHVEGSRSEGDIVRAVRASDGKKADIRLPASGRHRIGPGGVAVWKKAELATYDWSGKPVATYVSDVGGIQGAVIDVDGSYAVTSTHAVRLSVEGKVLWKTAHTSLGNQKEPKTIDAEWVTCVAEGLVVISWSELAIRIYGHKKGERRAAIDLRSLDQRIEEVSGPEFCGSEMIEGETCLFFYWSENRRMGKSTSRLDTVARVLNVTRGKVLPLWNKTEHGGVTWEDVPRITGETQRVWNRSNFVGAVAIRTTFNSRQELACAGVDVKTGAVVWELPHAARRVSSGGLVATLLVDRTAETVKLEIRHGKTGTVISSEDVGSPEWRRQMGQRPEAVMWDFSVQGFPGGIRTFWKDELVVFRPDRSPVRLRLPEGQFPATIAGDLILAHKYKGGVFAYRLPGTK